MATIVLRSDRENPLSIQDVDNNFINLNSDKLEVSQFTGTSILNLLRVVDGAGSGLDADIVDGMQPSAAADPSTLAARDASGNLTANTFNGSLNGNAATVTNGVYTNQSYSNPTWIASLAGSKVTSIPNTSLANSFVTLNGTAVSLGGSYDITSQSLNWLTGTQTFNQNRFIIADGTKRANFNVSLIPDNTSRTLLIPNTAGTPTIATEEYVQTAGRNSQGAKTVQSISAGIPSNATGANGDIIYQF